MDLQHIYSGVPLDMDSLLYYYNFDSLSGNAVPNWGNQQLRSGHAINTGVLFVQNGSGVFSGNSQLKLSNFNSLSGQSFSLGMTIDKRTSGRCLLFNSQIGNSGLAFGITDHNKFYVHSKSGDINQFYVAENLHLGKRNSVILTCANNQVSIHRLDMYSDTSVSESFVFDVRLSPHGGSGRLGHDGSYYSGYNISGFQGEMDNFFLSNIVPDQGQINSLVSGFKSLTGGSVTGYSASSTYSGVKFVDTGVLLTTGQKFPVEDFVSKLNSYALTGVGTGVYQGSFSGYVSGNSLSISGRYTGLYNVNDVVTFNSTYNDSYNLTGNIISRSYYGNEDLSNVALTHQITYSVPDIQSSNMHVYASEQQVWTSTTGNNIGQNSEYLSGFDMEGVVWEEKNFAFISKYSPLTSVKPSGMGLVSVFDEVRQQFSVEKPNGDIVFYRDGVAVIGANVTNYYVNSVTGSRNSRAIYDNGTGATIAIAGPQLTMSLTGRYNYGNLSVFTNGYRRITGWYQTHSYDLLHNQAAITGSPTGVYNNNELYWE